MELTYQIDYNDRLKEYNKHVEELAEKRRKFYEENPQFPYKYLYMNVIAPPQKIELIEMS